MAHLRELDDVAYVRFASVYRNFREAKDFETALAELVGRRGRGERAQVSAVADRRFMDLRFMELALRSAGAGWAAPGRIRPSAR